MTEARAHRGRSVIGLGDLAGRLVHGAGVIFGNARGSSHCLSTRHFHVAVRALASTVETNEVRMALEGTGIVATHHDGVAVVLPLSVPEQHDDRNRRDAL